MLLHGDSTELGHSDNTQLPNSISVALALCLTHFICDAVARPIRENNNNKDSLN